MQTTADEVKYNLSRNGNGWNNVITESEIEVMLFLSLLLFSLQLVWDDASDGSSNSKQKVRKDGGKNTLHPITIRANKSLLTTDCLTFLSVTIGLQIFAGLTSCGLEETHRVGNVQKA